MIDGYEQEQRWRERHSTFVPPTDLFDPSRYGVEPIDSDKVARAFVERHHYSGSYPAARCRVGLFCKPAFEAPALVGVAVFSVPAQQAVIPKWTGQEPSNGVELGRFVLLDDVKFNAETWFLGRAFRLLRQQLPSVCAVASYSDPVPRRSAEGAVVLPGHVGRIYQGHNGRYMGRSRRRTLMLAPDGRVVSPRAISKIRNDERGRDYAMRQLLDMGAPPRRPHESGASYVQRAMAGGAFRRYRHPGNHCYVWGLTKGARRRLPQGCGDGYPRSIDAVTVAAA
jgi:hypothetical protein